jgi:glc operon protein GlcG
MYNRETIGFAEAQKAVDAMIAEASEEPDKPMAVCVSDDRGEPICFARMDGGNQLFTEMAIRKARTAVLFKRDTEDLKKRYESIGFPIYWWGPDYTLVPSGLAITKPGEGVPAFGPVYGGIGTSGRIGGEDIPIAEVGLQTIRSILWPSE